MTHITGIGGIFFKAQDREGLLKWYRDVLGVPVDEWGWAVPFGEDVAEPRFLQWSPFAADTDYFAPSPREFMINFRVRDLDGLLEKLAAKGVERVGEILDEPYGRFAWIMDPEGTKIELWEPKAPPEPSAD